MSRPAKILAAVAIALGLSLGAFACSPEALPVPQPETVSVSAAGYLTLDGKPTGVKIEGYEKQSGDESKSAHEIFLRYYPDYPYSAEQFESQLRAGTLYTRRDYDVIKDGELAAKTLSGSAAQKDGIVTADGLVAELDGRIVLPLDANSDFTISMAGTLAPDGKGGGQILSSDAKRESGRFYLGVNYDKGFIFLGVNMGGKRTDAAVTGGVYANYGWKADKPTLSTDHSYEITCSKGEFRLTVDGGESRPLDKMNLNQGIGREDFDGDAAGDELLQKLKLTFAQDYAELKYVGADTHKASFGLTSLSVNVSASFGYRPDAVSPLSGKRLLFLGSSVTRGHGGNTDGISFADDIAALTGAVSVKEAVSGTTLVDSDNQSYISRFKKFDFSSPAAALVVQLSTNDFSRGYSDREVTAAIETIAGLLTEAAPDCKLYFYTCPLAPAYSGYRRYEAFLPKLNELSERLGFEVIDLFGGDYVRVDGYLQSDGLHPTREAYASVFTPEITAALLAGTDA